MADQPAAQHKAEFSGCWCTHETFLSEENLVATAAPHDHSIFSNSVHTFIAWHKKHKHAEPMKG